MPINDLLDLSCASHGRGEVLTGKPCGVFAISNALHGGKENATMAMLS